MNLPVRGLASALSQFDANHVAWAQAAARHLASLGFDTRVATTRAIAEPWYVGEHLAFAPLREPPAKGAAAQDLVSTLAAHDDLLGALEKATGLAAEFADYRTLDRDWPVIVLSRSGQPLAQAIVFSEVVPPSPPVPPVLARLAFVAARLPLGEAQQLEGGDLLLLSQGPWPLAGAASAALSQAGLPSLGFDPAAGRLAPLLADPSRPPDGAQFDMSSSTTADGLTIPVTVHLADTVLTQADLARLTQSGTFDLGSVSEGLVATLSIGGRSIGRGEIVRIGDRFAVLLETQGSAEPDAPAESVGGLAEDEA